MVVDKEKQLKVDNWGTFFLHKLFLLYEKGDKCDGTLLFKDGQSIKVHKLVLMTCSDYFHEQLWVNNTFTLPPVLEHGAVLPIVNFMYTGFLNFNAEIHHSVFTAAKFLNVTILMKLLHAQLDNESLPQPAADPVNSSTTTTSKTSESFSSSSSSSTPSTTSLAASSVPTASSSSSSTPSSASVITTKSVLRKVKKLPKIAKPLFLTPQSSSSSFSVVAAASSSQSVPGKKLPFWKQRKTLVGGASGCSIATPTSSLAADYSGGRAAAVMDAAATALASPARFEVPPPLLDEVVVEGARVGAWAELPARAECSPYDTINHSSTPISLPPDESAAPIEQLTKEVTRLAQKRPHHIMKEGSLSRRSEVVVITDKHIDEDVDDDFDGDRTCMEPVEMDETTLLASADKRPPPQSSSAGGSSSEEKFERLLTRVTATPPKPILKPLTSESVSTGGGASACKKVRFSLAAEGKENTESANSVTAAVVHTATPPTSVATPTSGAKGAKQTPAIGCSKEVVTSRVSITGDKTANLNATQIISELMKKNPDLMKNNKNIRVSIVSGGGVGGVKVDKGGERETTKVRYIVMKQPTDEGGGGGGGGKSGATKNGAGGKGLTNAENTTGPWLCVQCGVAEHPMQFESYYLYRRHLHEVHQERIDARICEYCGYKSSKRNLHLYHLYTKHDVPPPRNIRFPKCDQCNYIALSDSLLIKHNNNHAASSDKLACKPCNLTFKTPTALQNHNQTCPHNKDASLSPTCSTPPKEYTCQYCQKTFNRSINLKAHMRIAHKNETLRRYDEDEEEEETAVAINMEDEHSSEAAATSNLLQVIRLPMINAGDDGGEGGEGAGGQRALLLPAGMFLTAGGEGVTASSASGFSSEQEAMSTVASGIAASLNLAEAGHQTVILLDGSSELVFESGNALMLQSAPTDGSTSAADGGTTEYIVPEVIAADNQLFQAHAQTVVSGDQDGQHMEGVVEHETLSVSEDVGRELPEGTSIIVVPPDDQMTSDAQTVLTTQQHLTADAVDELAGDLNSTAVVEEDNCTNIVEEACKRDTIIIETSSVVTTTTHEQKPDSVIVSTHAQLSQPTPVPPIDLAKDWDDVDSSDNRGDSNCDNNRLEERPSRATIEDMEETILPDLI